jgi:hypothetical protein
VVSIENDKEKDAAAGAWIGEALQAFGCKYIVLFPKRARVCVNELEYDEEYVSVECGVHDFKCY